MDGERPLSISSDDYEGKEATIPPSSSLPPHPSIDLSSNPDESSPTLIPASSNNNTNNNNNNNNPSTIKLNDSSSLPPSSSSISSPSFLSSSFFSDISNRPSRPQLNNPIPYRTANPDGGEIDLSLYLLTWNLHAKEWPSDLSPLIPLGFDIYAIATQECQQSLETSFIYSDKSRWRESLQKRLNKGASVRTDEDELNAGNEPYVLIGEHTLQALHLAIFVRYSLSYMITLVNSSSVATGIGGFIGNKGGIGIGFNCGETSLLFIASHFHAGQSNVGERNEDFKQIAKKLALRVPNNNNDTTNNNNNGNSNNSNNNTGTSSSSSSPSLAPSSSSSSLSSPSSSSSSSFVGPGSGGKEWVTNRFDRVFWLGDLNYRTNMERWMVDKLLEKKMTEVLLANDQLDLQRSINTTGLFEGFIEGPIKFPPTYKYDTGNDNFDTSSKQRVPSWTDRILWKNNDAIELLAYDSNREIRTSDHRAVYAIFRTRIQKIRPDFLKFIPKDVIHTQADSTVCSVQ